MVSCGCGIHVEQCLFLITLFFQNTDVVEGNGDGVIGAGEGNPEAVEPQE